MSKKETEPLTKHLVPLYEGDFAELTRLFPDVPASKIIRLLVRRTIQNSHLRATRQLDSEKANVD